MKQIYQRRLLVMWGAGQTSAAVTQHWLLITMYAMRMTANDVTDNKYNIKSFLAPSVVPIHNMAWWRFAAYGNDYWVPWHNITTLSLCTYRHCPVSRWWCVRFALVFVPPWRSYTVPVVVVILSAQLTASPNTERPSSNSFTIKEKVNLKVMW